MYRARIERGAQDTNDARLLKLTCFVFPCPARNPLNLVDKAMPHADKVTGSTWLRGTASQSVGLSMIDRKSLGSQNNSVYLAGKL